MNNYKLWPQHCKCSGAGILKKEVTYATVGTQKTYDKESNSINTSPVNVTFYGAKGIKGSIELKKLEKAAKKIETGKK